MFKILKNTVWQGLGKGVMVLIGLVTTSLLIRRLGEEVYGVFCLISSSLLLVDAIAEMGTKMIGVREITKSDNKEKMFINVVFLRLLQTGVAMFLGAGFVFFYPAFRVYKIEVLLALSMSFWTFVAGNLEIRFQAEERMAKKSLVDSLFLFLFLLIFLIFRDKTNLVAVFEFYLVARVLSLLVGFKLVGKLRLKREDIEKKTVVGIFKQSLPMGIFLLLFTAYDKAIDSLIIERFLGTSEVAWYSLAYKVYGNLVMPAYFLVNSAFPSFAREAKQGGKITYKKIMLISVAMSLIILPLVWLGAPIMMKVLSGSEFNWQVSTQVLRILSLGLVFNFVNHVKGFYLISRDGEKRMLVLGVISLVFNLGANLVFVPMYGVIGAAWVTMATEALMSGIYLIVNSNNQISSIPNKFQ